jgi:hypothetical protein
MDGGGNLHVSFEDGKVGRERNQTYIIFIECVEHLLYARVPRTGTVPFDEEPRKQKNPEYASERSEHVPMMNDNYGWDPRRGFYICTPRHTAPRFVRLSTSFL